MGDEVHQNQRKEKEKMKRIFEDLLDEIYDEKADEKFKNKTPREGKQALDFSVELMKQSDTYNIDEAEKLFHEMKG